MKGLATKAKQLTKRQRKLSTPPNAMVKKSMREGSRIIVGGREYFGRVVQYGPIYEPMMPVRYVKTAAGIPFVRSSI